jgi:penicillin-binding protein 1A
VTGVWLGNDDSSPTRKATGGGLPVEIWSHFMKPAHQGVAVVALPETETGGLSLTAMLGGPAGTPGGTPVPPAPVGVSSGAPGRMDHSTSLDGWLLDRLFGRH